MSVGLRAASIVLLSCAFTICVAAAPTAKAIGEPVPEFTHHAASAWLNSKPLTVADLKGKVVLLDFWTYECWNCYRSFPWLTTLEQQFAGKPFEVIGIHSPEYEREKDPGRIAAKALEFELHHPIMIDNDHSYWQALDNQYWPAYYLIDGNGIVRAVFVGETHAGDARAQRVQAAIADLLDALPAPASH